MAGLLHRDWGTTPINTRNYQAIAKREVSAPEWNVIGNPGRGWRHSSREVQIRRSDPRADIWLQGSDKWNKRFPDGWKAIRVLGTGGFGIAGHWQYRGAQPYKKGSVESRVRDIVVKQSSTIHNNGLAAEAIIMELLTKTGSRHVPRLYGGLHRDVGRQDQVVVDQKRREVHRIFMEYCEGGSLHDFVSESSYYNDLAHENQMWAYFHCLAKAIVMFELGHEVDSDRQHLRRSPWQDAREIVHFDLKPDNSLITHRDEHGEHKEHERVVVSDFGLSQCLPNERRAGPHMDHNRILNAFEEYGTENFRAPEQRGLIIRARRRYGACTNIYQVGCIMFCIMMMNTEIVSNDPPIITPLTGANKPFLTIGGDHLELVDERSRTLRGLIAECLFLDPAQRPTGVELLKRTREGLRHHHPHAAEASKRDEKLNPVSSLLLDGWFGRQPSLKWPRIIPEMQAVVELREKQLDQVERAKAFARDKRYAGRNPAAGVNQPAGLAKGRDPPANNDQQKAPPAAKDNDAGDGQRHLPKKDPVKINKPWPGKKFDKPVQILTRDRPREPKNPPADKEPQAIDWEKIVKGVRGGFKGRVPGHVPWPRKRTAQAPPVAPAPKRSRGNGAAPARQISVLDKRLNKVNINRTGQATKPPATDKSFPMPVRIWPGPQPGPTDDALIQTRYFDVPIGATLNDLMKVMNDDDSTGVRRAIRCIFAMPGTIKELPMSTTLSSIGYGPATRSRRPHLECFRTMVPPPQAFGPGGALRSFSLTVRMRLIRSKEPQLTMKVGYQMTIKRLKEAIIEADMHPDFRLPSQLRLHYAGDDPQGKDFPDDRIISNATPFNYMNNVPPP
ncbi:hypothetical protein V494_04548 [Pseudogymnoascus sp. VKM F-4513 (FW-928)]|nr:hypothetical protein V494_04548 [Pseudogymnoascus sp. VKM F-4513 (FW-928)]